VYKYVQFKVSHSAKNLLQDCAKKLITASNIGWWFELLAFPRSWTCRSWCIVQIFDALFKFDVVFASYPIIVPHLHHRRRPRCILLHLIPFLRTIVNYIIYVSPVLNHQSMLFMTRREVQKKFQQCNPDVLHYTIFGRAAEEQRGYTAKISFGPHSSS
jgi:hypothetical protein